MSQVSIIDITGNHPQIPIQFDANDGFAVPIANVLEILSEVTVAGSIPTRTVGSGNTITTQIQTSQAIMAADATKIGMAAFDSASFSVSAEGFVTLTVVGEITTLTGNDAIPVNSLAGNINVTGTTANNGINLPVWFTNNPAGPGSLQLQVQVAAAVAPTPVNSNFVGLACFSNVDFTVDNDSAMVALSGTGAGKTITGNSGGPLAPTANNWNLLGSGSITTSGSVSTLTTQLTGLTNHAVLVGAGTDTITKVAPSATLGIPLVSQGVSADPVFGTASVPGGGTGAVTLTGVLIGNGTAAITGNPITQYTVLVGGASNAISSIGPGNAGQVFQSGGASSNPAYSTATYPSTSSAAGKILYGNGTNFIESVPTFPASASATSRKMTVSDGTNWVASTETWAVPGTSGHVLTSDGTNWISSAPVSPGWSLITSITTAGAQTTINFTSASIVNYNRLMITWNSLTTTGSALLRVGFSTNGGSSYTLQVANWVDAVGVTSTGSANSGPIYFITGGGQTNFNNGYIIIENPNLSIPKAFVTFTTDNSNNANTQAGRGCVSSTSQLNAIQINCDANAFTNGKVVNLYGQ